MQHVRGPFPSFSRAPGRRVLVSGGLALAIALCASGASAQAIYKWVDERGVVNYGNADVPKSRDVSIVDTAPPVALQPDAKRRESATPASKLSDADLLRQELVRTRDENARLRQNVAQFTPASAPQHADVYAAWREQCERQRHVDCDEGTFVAEARVAPLIRQPVLVRQPVKVLPRPVPAKSAQNTPRPLEYRRNPPKYAVAKPLTTTQ